MLKGSGPESCILQIKGRQAQSEFKIQQLLADIHSVVPQLQSLYAEHCYFVQVESPLSKEEFDRLLQLIDGDRYESSGLLDSETIYVVPRFGTISPWCTKAMEIIRRCGFEKIRRVERGTLWKLTFANLDDPSRKERISPFLFDRMVESILFDTGNLQRIFETNTPQSTSVINILASGKPALSEANQQMGLALSNSELDYVYKGFSAEKRNPTDAELMMFSQVNSEHCRHKIFNAEWKIDGEPKQRSMFSMIRETHKRFPERTLVAYEDNASVIEGLDSEKFAPGALDRKYQYTREPVHVVYKAETHNHPTAISPFPGAATGAGGEIRDEGATGRGGKPKAGLCGFSVSHLRIPEYLQPWEHSAKSPDRIASPLRIMLEGPIGAASFNNEFGRPNIGGYFRTFEWSRGNPNSWYGYHKPIMFAGGIGNIRPSQIEKHALATQNLLIVIGGPSMLIGLGGGTASSLGHGQSGEELDFTSVQRSNPEMQRRCQEVIDRCTELGAENPIISIHDVGAGGLSNALPEIVHASGLGARIDLDKIPNDDPGMSPMQIWCNEAQERYVLSISSARLKHFSTICERERCPYAVMGAASSEKRLIVRDDQYSASPQEPPVDVDMEFLMGGFLRTERAAKRKTGELPKSTSIGLEFHECVERVLRFPSVGDKSFLITIGDRTVTGLTHRDQMVGPWQVPVADASVTLSGYDSYTGEAVAIGERTPIAVRDAPASARMAVGEALTNLRSAGVGSLDRVRLSANWMAAANVPGEDCELYDAVRSVALDLCMELGVSIPVGKDSLSMYTRWPDQNGTENEVYAPVSLIISAFTSIEDVRKSLTPQLLPNSDTVLLFIDLGGGKNRMGMSTLHQTLNLNSGSVPDLDSVPMFKNFFEAMGLLISQDLILAYHDRSDGGLLATLCEMAFAGRTGLEIHIEEQADPIEFFFNEELGAVIQVESKYLDRVRAVFEQFEIWEMVRPIGSPNHENEVTIVVPDWLDYKMPRTALHRAWSELTWKMQSIRDNPECAQQEFDRILDVKDPGLAGTKDFTQGLELGAPNVTAGVRPSVAILREQGINGHIEMAAAFERAGFDAFDTAMTDILERETMLDRFDGIVMCGGFSFGDVLGAGRGWASSILFDNKLRDLFESYFSNTAKFALGVCNGCQVMAELKSIIPGAEAWPKFVRNRSEQFEARLTMVSISESNSMLMAGMQGLHLPIAVAHGEGRAKFEKHPDCSSLLSNHQLCLHYSDNEGRITDSYPYNPNGSEGAVAGITNLDGRITVMMPHPERVFRTVQHSWAPDTWSEDGPWMTMFRNAKRWLD